MLSMMTLPNTSFAGGETKAITESVVNHATNEMNSAIESWALNNLPGVRLLEIDTKLRGNTKPDIRLITIMELSDDEYRKWLTQISFSSHDTRETLNLGLVWRKANADKTIIYGVNTFYDMEFNSNQQRIGVGFEMKSSVYDLNINSYWALSDKKHVDGNPEEVMDGYDIEVGLHIPHMPWATVYYKGYKFDSSIYNLRNGEQISLKLQPTPVLSVELGRQDDNSMSSSSFVKVNYLLCCSEHQNVPFMFMSPVAYSYKSVENRFFERVRRNNNVVTAVAGSVTVARGN